MAETAPSTFLITIAAVDKATAVFNAVNAKIAAFEARVARTMAPVKALGASLKKLSDATGVTKLGNAFRGLMPIFRSVHEMAGRVFRAFTAIAAPLAALSGAASIAGLGKLVSTWGDFGLQLSLTAQRARLTVGQLSGIEQGAALAGSSAQAAASGMTALNDNLVNARGGRAPEFIAMANSLGVFNVTSKTSTELLPELADKIASIKDPVLQARAAVGLFGSAGEELLPYLRRGSAGIAQLTEEARRHGLVTEQGAEIARAYAHAQRGVQQSVKGLGNAIAQRLAPHLIPLLDRLSSWVDANRERIASFFDRLGAWIDGIDFDKVAKGVTDFANGVDAVVQKVGGWQTAIELVLGLIAAKWAIGILAPVANLALALGGVIRRFAVLTTTSVPALARSMAGLGGGTALLGRLGLAGLGGYAAHEALSAVDNDDRMGTWIDTNIPGAGAVDNFAARFGLGRTYAEQHQRQAAVDIAGARAASGAGGQGARTGQQASAEQLAETRFGQGPGQVQDYLQKGGVNLNAAQNAWCAAFVNSSLAQVGVKGSGSMVATSFLNWGNHQDMSGVAKGDVLVQARGRGAGQPGGHVGFATGNTRVVNGQEQVELFSGNYGNKVSRSWEDARSLEARRATEISGAAQGPGAANINSMVDRTKDQTSQADIERILGSLNVNVNHNNAPAGVSVTATTTGAMPQPTVQRSMAGAS